MTQTPPALLETPYSRPRGSKCVTVVRPQQRGDVSLSDHILIAQDKPLVEHYSRQSARRWLLAVANELSDQLEIASIGCKQALEQIYLNVDGIARAPARGDRESTWWAVTADSIVPFVPPVISCKGHKL